MNQQAADEVAAAKVDYEAVEEGEDEDDDDDEDVAGVPLMGDEEQILSIVNDRLWSDDAAPQGDEIAQPSGVWICLLCQL